MRPVDLLLLSLLRHPARLALAILPMCLAFCGYILVASLESANDFGAELDRAGRIVTINRQSVMQPLPVAFVDRIAALDGVKAVTYVTWFGGFYLQPENKFSQYAIDPESYFAVYPELELPEQVWARWRDDRRAALVSERLARKFGWKPGDFVALTSTIWQQAGGGNDWPFVIVGLIPEGLRGIEPGIFLLRHDYFEDGRAFARGTISFAVTRLEDAASADEVILAIDSMFRNGTTPTFSATESDFVESFQRQLGDLSLLTRLISMVVILVVLLIASSALAQAIAERERELAVMRAIGFSRRRIALQLAGETVLTVALAAVIALMVAVLAFALMRWADLPGPFRGLQVTATDMLEILGLAAILGILGSLLPLLRHAGAGLARQMREG